MNKVNKRADKPRFNQVISSILITNGRVRGISREAHALQTRASMGVK